MAAPGEDFSEHDTTGVSANPQPQQKHGRDDDSGVGVGEKRWPGWPGESVFRILVPSQKVGSIIGRKGDIIKKITEETKARIKVLDGPPGTQERAVLISAREEPDNTVPPAIDGLLRVHMRIIDGLDGDLGQGPPGITVSSRLLVGATQAGSLIGKQGTTIKSIQEASNTIVRVLGSDNLPYFALEDDRVVEIQGEPSGVHKALEIVASHLRKFLVDRSVIGLFEMQMQMPNSHMEHSMPPHQSWGPPHGLPPNAGPGPGFGGNPQYMPPHQGPPHQGPPPHQGHPQGPYQGPPPHQGPPPPHQMRQHDNYYPPADLPPMEKQPHQGLSMYGRDAPVGVHQQNNAQPVPQQMITQVTQHMQIPLSYADAVIGTGGSNISYTRRASGATVTIQETRGLPGEMTVEVNGSASQVQAAQQLIQNFMADAAAAAQNPGGPPADPNYNAYQAQNTMYSAPQDNNGGHGGQAGGGYGGPVYGNNYGY